MADHVSRAKKQPQTILKKLTGVVSGGSEHIAVTVMTHGARLILISVRADDFKENLCIDFGFLDTAIHKSTASYELARTVAETFANPSTIPQ